jgi:hypothetical protein
MFNWIKNLFKPKQSIQDDFLQQDIDKMLAEVRQKPKRPRLYKQSTVVTTGELPKGEKKMATKPGLYANIHKKQERIEQQKASGAKKVETMRKPGTKGAPTAEAFKQAAKTAKKK